MKLFTLIFLALLIIGKIILGSIFIYQVKADPLGFDGNAIASEPPKNAATQTDQQGLITEKKDIDLDFLLKKQNDLKVQEEELAKTKMELMAIQEDINTKIARLTRLRNDIREQINLKKSREAAKLRHLIKAYSAMKPQKAASLIEKLDINFAIELLSNMKGDAVGSILTFVEVGKAAKISEGLAKR